MMKSMKGLALRFFQTNKFIACSSIVSVMLSISLIITMAIFAANAQQTVVNEVKKIYGDMDLSVGYNIGQNKIIDKRLLNDITSQEGIQQFSSVLVTHLKVNQLQADVYAVGVENDSLAKSRYHFHKNVSDHEVMLNKDLAEALNVKAGDRVLIENKPYTVKEVLNDLDATGVAPDMLILSRSTVQQLMYEKTSVKNEATYILVKAKEDTDVLTLVHHIRQIDPDLRIDVAEENEFLKSNLASLNIFMIVLSMLLLIVTSLLIISNFEVFLYKYRNQFAIMRSIGATAKQMFKVVLLQCSFMNIVGAALGFLLALISNQFLQKWFEKLFSFQISTMDFNYRVALEVMFISMLMIEIFMLIPSFRSAKVLPLKIMQDNEQIDFAQKGLRKKLGKGLLISGLLLIIIGKIVPKSEGIQVICVLAAALLFIFGIFILFPVYLSPILTRLLPVIKSFAGNVSFIAIKNVIPQVKKNTFVVLTISTMMMIAVFGSALLKTLEKNEEQYLKQQYPTNIVVTNRVSDKVTINPSDIRAAIDDMISVQAVSTISTISSAELKQGNHYVSFNYALGDLKEMEKQGLLPSIPKNVNNIIIVTKDFADKNNLHVGDKMELGLYSEAAQKVEPIGTVMVADIVETLPGSYADAYMDWKNITYKNRFTVFNRAFISSNDEKSTLKKLEGVKEQYPELQIHSYNESLKKSKQMFYQRWSIFIVVIIVMLLSVMLGVFNTLINNIHSKRKEFAILRVLSIDKKGVVRVILTQVILYILIGVTLGIFIGVLLTYVTKIIDGGRVYINFTFMAVIAAIMFGTALVIFIPFANKLGKRKLTLELTQDNK
ncbi:FtsX-like permease family protein [Symbiobacterium thermophilum]|uniref:ABC transporter n=1 Tax=Symbiobacterium thermophilum TaxID=2734 RepID=A0A953LL97_SYMTR|nr:FtsX-like permease family protein [Symbiobacterium thermophilum]MBY6277912.1 ABC transporter [Symbiobacterium thermophilum]